MKMLVETLFFILVLALCSISVKAVTFTNDTSNSTLTSTTIHAGLNVTDFVGDWYSFVDFDRSLVLWWRLDGNSNDSSSYENRDGIVTGATAQNTGKYNTSYNLSAGGPKQIRYSGVVENFSNPYTVSFWVMLQQNRQAATYEVFKIRSSDVNQTLVQTNCNNNFNLRIDTSTKINQGSQCFGIANLSWNHVAIVYNGTDMLMYSNGIANGTFLINGTVSYKSPFIQLGGNTAFNGSIDELVIFNRTLSNSEIQSLYNSSRYAYTANYTNLQNGIHTLQGYAVNTSGFVEDVYREVIINTSYVPPIEEAVISDTTKAEAQLAVTIFSIFITLGLFIAPFGFNRMVSSEYLKYVIRGCCITFGIFMTSLVATMIVTMSTNDGLGLSKEMFLYLFILNNAAYISMVLVVIGFGWKILDLYKFKKRQRREGIEE